MSSKKSESKATKRSKKKVTKQKSIIKFRCDYFSTPMKVLQARGWLKVEDEKWDIYWCDTSELKEALEGHQLRPQQRVAHFLSHSELTRKNYLYRNLKRYKRLLLRAGKSREAELCDAMPISFELPSEYRMLVEEHRRSPGTIWIVKPASGSRGRGIFLFQRLKDLNEWRIKECINLPTTTSNGSDCEIVNSPDIYVVQKYIDDPYLLEGRKFDLRIYVLVTSFQPLKVWLAREGFARLSSEQFSLERIDDCRVHLTNMSIQLKPHNRSTDFDDQESPIKEKEFDEESSLGLGRKWPLSCLREYLIERHGSQAVHELFKNIAAIIMASLQAVQSSIVPLRNSFELYGYDILLDERLRPWLLEVNASPSLNATDPADFRLKFDLVDDVLSVLDLERKLTGRELRVGGLDLLWNDAPVWRNDDNDKADNAVKKKRQLNIFLGIENDRLEQLQSLSAELAGNEANRSAAVNNK